MRDERQIEQSMALLLHVATYRQTQRKHGLDNRTQFFKKAPAKKEKVGCFTTPFTLKITLP